MSAAARPQNLFLTSGKRGVDVDADLMDNLNIDGSRAVCYFSPYYTDFSKNLWTQIVAST